MKYLAVGFWVNEDSKQTFTLSREIDIHIESAQSIANMLGDEGGDSVNLDTILIMKSIERNEDIYPPEVMPAPAVVHHWTVSNGDFD